MASLRSSLMILTLSTALLSFATTAHALPLGISDCTVDTVNEYFFQYDKEGTWKSATILVAAGVVRVYFKDAKGKTTSVRNFNRDWKVERPMPLFVDSGGMAKANLYEVIEPRKMAKLAIYSIEQNKMMGLFSCVQRPD